MVTLPLLLSSLSLLSRCCCRHCHSGCCHWYTARGYGNFETGCAAGGHSGAPRMDPTLPEGRQRRSSSCAGNRPLPLQGAGGVPGGFAVSGLSWAVTWRLSSMPCNVNCAAPFDACPVLPKDKSSIPTSSNWNTRAGIIRIIWHHYKQLPRVCKRRCPTAHAARYS